MKIALAFIWLIFFSFAANSQAHKCKGADGRYSYSDKPCVTGTTGGTIQLRENTIDSRMDWERNERYIRNRQQEDLREKQTRRSELNHQSPQVIEPSGECERAIRAANTQTGNASPQKWDADRGQARRICGFDPWPGPSAAEVDAYNKRSKAIEEAARRRRSNERLEDGADLINCDAAGCWDTNGNRYNNTGGGIFIRSDGASCVRAGPSLNCH